MMVIQCHTRDILITQRQQQQFHYRLHPRQVILDLAIGEIKYK